MTPMINRVARAICLADCGVITRGELKRCQGLAKAALTELQAPSDPMLVAGGLKYEGLMFEGDPEFTGVIFKDMGTVFTAMISSALSEDSP